MFYITITFAMAVGLNYVGLPVMWNIACSCSFYLCLQHKWMYLFVKTFPRDFKLLVIIIKFIFRLATLTKGGKNTIPEIFSQTVKKFRNKTAIISADTKRQMTFKEVEDFANKIANVFLKYNFTRGDVVGIYLWNELEYVPIWLGLSKIGVVACLINTNLSNKSLQHSVESGNCKAIITQAELSEFIQNIQPALNQDILYFSLDLNEASSENESNFIPLKRKLADVTSMEPTKPVGLTLHSHMLYIFTSGTTGLPKPAILPTVKVLQGFCLFNVSTNVTQNDVVYNVLPMYHTGGSIIFTGQMILAGATMVIRRKFSASEYFNDCVRYNITYMSYIGEMCRYLLLQPENECERSHQIRCAVGNGLRSSLFKPFRKRFGIKEIYEFYGATEANSGFINTANKDGAIGFFPVSMWFLNFKGLVKVNPENGSIIRDAKGLAIKCQPGEAGQLVNSIGKGQDFHGYVDKKSSEKKIARNIFRHGDAVFLSGDILTQDCFGFLYFIDRLGDTFRWKGENVSTTEVENIISNFMNFEEALVYPVTIPGCEGKAGMAYIKVKSQSYFNIASVAEHMKQNLPRYAIPLFIRTGSHVSVTGTLKHNKIVLKGEGYDVNKIKDDERIYFFNAANGNFVEFTSQYYEQVQSGLIRF